MGDITSILGLLAASLSVLSGFVVLVRWIRRRLGALADQITRIESSMRTRPRARISGGTWAALGASVRWIESGTAVEIIEIVGDTARVRLVDLPVEFTAPVAALSSGDP